jgi:AcrR family transcriptional regulator
MPGRSRNRGPLSRDRIVRAAVAVADAGGFDGLSMRAIAVELGTAPMSLYRHVTSKEDLLNGMVEVVFSEMYRPRIDGDWKAELRERGDSARGALLRHPWAVGRMEGRLDPGPATEAHHNATMGCLREAGFPLRDAIHAYSILDAYTYGFLLQELTLPFETPEESGELAAATIGDRGEANPYLAETVVELGERGYDYAEEFGFGLDFILEGLARLRKAPRSGRRSR